MMVRLTCSVRSNRPRGSHDHPGHARRSEQLRHAVDHQRRGDVSRPSALPGPVQPVDRELVHRPDDPLHVPRDGRVVRVRGDLCLWRTRPELLAADLHGRRRCTRRIAQADGAGARAEIPARDRGQGRAGRRQHDRRDEGTRLPGRRQQRTVARHRRDPADEVPVPAERHHAGSRGDGGPDGACKFPANNAEAVLANVKALLDEEADRIGQLDKASSAAEVRAIFGGEGYAAGDDD